MAVFLYSNHLAVEVFDDTEFTQGADNPTSYGKVIQVEKDKPYSPNSQHAIKVYENDKVIRTAIILASGGGTGIHEHAALIDENNLVIRCCNKLFCLSLPELELNWVTDADWATCFSVHKYQDTYITHGEASVARIDREGEVLWKFGGADIFVCLNEGSPFDMQEDFIDLMDFSGNKYRVDYNGETISYEPSRDHAQVPVVVDLKSQKPWWKFW